MQAKISPQNCTNYYSNSHTYGYPFRQSNLNSKPQCFPIIVDPKYLETGQETQDNYENFYEFIYEKAFDLGYFIPLSVDNKLKLKSKVKSIFNFAYNGYKDYAYPLDELDPINCIGRGPDNNTQNLNINDVLGNYQLTLVDSLDSLKILDESQEFQSNINKIKNNLHFNTNSTVHIFESTIRIIGGLLSSFQLNNYKPTKLLNLATDLADKILPAFNSPTKIPYARVHLNSSTVDKVSLGIPPGAVGGMLIEFTTLSRLTGDDKYEKNIRAAIRNLYNKRTTKGLFGSEINVETFEWINSMAGIGAGIDSLYECLLKNYIAYGEEEDLAMYKSITASINKYIKPNKRLTIKKNLGDLKEPCYPYTNVDAFNGNIKNNWVDSLSAFYPGLLVLEGSDLEQAICLHANYWLIFSAYSATPERFNYFTKNPELNWYPLRPELVESTYLLYRATGHSFYQHVGAFILNSFDGRCKSNCGYGTIHNVLENDLEDRQESFFLSETLKYLYLLFDEENDLHKRSDYVFTTEAHIIFINNTKSNNQKQNWSYQSKPNFARSVVDLMNKSSTYLCSYQQDYSKFKQQDFLKLLNYDIIPKTVLNFV